MQYLLAVIQKLHHSGNFIATPAPAKQSAFIPPVMNKPGGFKSSSPPPLRWESSQSDNSFDFV